MTIAQNAEVALLQKEAQKELGVQGLAMSWIRQEMTKKRLPKQEEEITKLFNEKATDERSTIQLISTLSVMTAEAQNYGSMLYAMDLTAYATQANRRTNSATLSQSELGDTSTVSVPSATPTNGNTAQ